ncbi:MAG: hypothetical protein H0T79_01715, partial [Deltaproteobacteria bacterium]|nr:hypothetical protein [Deltaproteobacteria bacterium]
MSEAPSPARLFARALLVLVPLVAGACGSRTISERERVLAAMPAEASAVFAADGVALGHPRFRPIIDALRPRWPVSMGCVIDAALAADQVAAATTEVGTTIVITGKMLSNARCPALSKHGALW